ncbi:30S ribosomal protein S8e [Candidatus Parvarchaeota archaeon]|nr:30S ribosomal protein S8e [Candidatus Parvarchaeota archaeon]
MEQYHGKSGSKISGTGGKRHKSSDKKLYLSGSPFTATKLGESEVRKLVSGRGRTFKVKLKHAAYANVLTNEGMKKARIKNVMESPANRNYARQNLMTKGTIIDTDAGRAKITNRVGQDGVVNCVLV